MFAYEHEVRVVFEEEKKDGEVGHAYEWDPESIVQLIAVHPESDRTFMETVATSVKDYAPALADRVRWSAMRELPPLTMFE
jgi:hypothetical protein